MDNQTARTFVEAERSRWLPGAQKYNDKELLRRREQYFNGLTLLLGLACLPGWFFLGVYGSFFIVLIYFAKKCSSHADACKKVRVFLETGTSHDTEIFEPAYQLSSLIRGR